MTNSSEQSPSTPPVSGVEKSGKKTKNSPEALPPTPQRLDPKAEKVEKLAKETLWQRIVGEDEKPAEDSVNEPAEPSVEGEIDLSDTEAKEIALDHVEARQDDVSDELMHTTPGSVESLAAAADAVLLERDQTHLTTDTETFQAALQAASHEAERALQDETGGQAADAPPLRFSAEQSQPPNRPPTPPEAERFPPIFTPYEQQQVTPPVAEKVGEPTPLPVPTRPEAQVPPARSIPNGGPERPRDNWLGSGSPSNFFGRKRLRKQTERLLRPFQQKTEQDITHITSAITAQETQIRELAATRYAEQRRVQTAPVQEATLPSLPIRETIRQTRSNEAIAPLLPAEKLGTPAVARETLPSLNHGPETLSDTETLLWAEKIIIDGASIRSVYEARRISESGLKHVVREYLRGGNVRKVLAQALLEKELSYERDPVLRDHFAGADISGSATSHFGTSNSSATSSSSTTAPTPPRASKRSAQTTLANLANSPQKAAMAAWVTFIVVLAVFAAILLLTK